MQRRWRCRGIPHDLRVVMGVEINKARSNDTTLGIDGLGRGLGDVTDRHNATIAHANIGPESVTTGSINNRAALDQKIEHENSP